MLMQNSNYNTRAFTVLEAVVTLAVSAIVIALVYQIYVTLSMQFRNYERDQMQVFQFQQFQQLVAEDVKSSSKIESVDEDGLLLHFVDSEIEYAFAKAYTIRISKTRDTFPVVITNAIWTRSTKSYENFESLHLETNLLGNNFSIFEEKQIDLATRINNRFINEY